MAKPLVIVESKAKANTIAGFLGRDRYTVMASVGHIRDLPQGAKQAPKNITKPEVRRLGIDVDDHFAPVYVVPDNKKQVVSQLKAALKGASELYLATDEDREGEAISWHLLEVLKPSVPVKRMVFHEITSEAIDEAIDNWRDLDMKLVEAQEGRRVLDRLVGYEVSNVAFRRIGPGTSAGRVQSVATRLVVDRERARMAFRAASYWDLEGTFTPRDGRGGECRGQQFPATLVSIDGRRLASGRDFDPDTGALGANADVVLLDEGGAAALADRLADRPFDVASVESRVHNERPKAPFITSTLQQEAARKLGFSAGARDARRAGPLRARAHHLHAHRLHRALRPGGASGAVADRPHVRRRVPARPAAVVPQQGQERAGGARGDPPGGRPHAHRRRPAARAQGQRRVPPLRPHLEAHGRVADGRRPHPPRDPPARGHVDVGRGGGVPGHRAAPSSSRATSAPTSKAPTTPTPSSKTASRSSRSSKRANASTAPSCARRATRRSRPRATPRRAW